MINDADETIGRATASLLIKGGDKEAAGLAIENDRMQTSIMVLHQKLNN